MKLTASNVAVTNTLSVSRLTIGNNAVVESVSIGNVSINSSAVAVGNVSITPAAISTPSLILGGTAFGGGLLGGIVDYQEFTASGTWYNPYANASVNTSLTGYEQVLVMAWGGGGGSASNNTFNQGGGGGACALGYYTLSSLANTVTVTVGSGGTASRTTTTSTGAGGNGGNSVFGALSAYGGGGAVSSGPVGGGGGGALAAGVNTSGAGAAPLGGATGNPGGISTYGGGGGGNAGGANGGASVFGGGGGNRGSGYGGISVYGGGGGSGDAVGANAISVFGGNGGNGGGAGSIPGGGGSGNTTAANTGARGEVRVWVIGPGSTTAGAPTYGLTANTTTLYEGSSVLYTVQTTNVANNTTLYYTLNNSSTAVATDFTTAVNGSVVINGGTGAFTLTANNDTDSANEAFQVDVRTGSESGTIVASNGSVSIVPAPAISYVNATVTGTVSTTNLTLDKPTGTQENDIMIAFMGLNVGKAQSWTGDTGWTEIYDQTSSLPSLRIAYKVAGASEPSSYTFTGTISGGAGYIVSYRNATYDTIGTPVFNASPLTPSLPTISVNNSLIVGVGMYYQPGNTWTVSGSMTTRVLDNDGTGLSSIIADEFVNAGASGTRTFTATANAAVGSVILALKPSG